MVLPCSGAPDNYWALPIVRMNGSGASIQRRRYLNLADCGTKPLNHEGEDDLQRELGVHEQMVAAGRGAIRDYMPPQHQQFFTKLQYLIIGASDVQGRLWASVLEGKPDFLELAL